MQIFVAFLENLNFINKEVPCSNRFDNNIYSFFRKDRSSLATTSQIATIIKLSSPYQLALVVRSEATTPRNLHNPSSKLHLQWGRGRLLLLLDCTPHLNSPWERKKKVISPKTIAITMRSLEVAAQPTSGLLGEKKYQGKKLFFRQKVCSSHCF